MNPNLIKTRDVVQKLIEGLGLAHLLKADAVDQNHRLYDDFDTEAILITYGEELSSPYNRGFQAVTVTSGSDAFKLEGNFHVGNCSLRSDDANFYDLPSAVSAAISQAVYLKLLGDFRREATKDKESELKP